MTFMVSCSSLYLIDSKSTDIGNNEIIYLGFIVIMLVENKIVVINLQL